MGTGGGGGGGESRSGCREGKVLWPLASAQGFPFTYASGESRCRGRRGCRAGAVAIRAAATPSASSTTSHTSHTLSTSSQETPAILGSPLLRDLPTPLALSHLFSRLPPSVKAPHERSGLSAAQYSMWLDEHGAAEVVASVGDALGAAEAEGKVGEAERQVVDLMRALCAGAGCS